MHPMLNIAVRAARSAGNLIARTIGQSENFEVAQKNKDDLVTSIDKQCEKMIAETLFKSYRDHCILTEESGVLGNPDSEYQWVIDPIDGTTNFVKGIGHCAISMALRHNGKTEVAVVFDPMMDEMFTAARGEGAFLNGRRIRVSSADSLDGSIIGTAFPTRHRDRMNAYLEIFTRLINNCADIRRMGSASLDLCYVACGRLDGYLEQGLKEWDFAAGELILREAGGLATDFLGEPNYVKSGNIVSGNPTMVRNLIKLCDPQSLDAILR
ncbi:MAG: inositol-1-monophosphatase [Succinivibrio sp.]|jgi:myo-inositol-1(or 4)-monophosphatase|nr:inositol-1-monophosphatase [Succinivibrio sp.]MBR1613758.1 inositol-1-monophosphatase [Succinivibrio sp.]